jgi:hypothetical protein
MIDYCLVIEIWALGIIRNLACLACLSASRSMQEMGDWNLWIMVWA